MTRVPEARPSVTERVDVIWRDHMDRVEKGFAALEQAAGSVLKAISQAQAVAKQLSKAARAGDLNAAKKSLERLQGAAQAVSREASGASAAWPFDSAGEEA